MYPKTLYNGGCYTVVKNTDEEMQAKSKGYIDPNEDTIAIQKDVSEFGSVNIDGGTYTTNATTQFAEPVLSTAKRGRPRKAA